jgi:nucleotide-binding universal stress UspA family protein
MTAIVVGLDASDGAAAALRWAAEEARLRSASLVVVHAYRVPVAYVHDDASVASIDPELHGRADDELGRLLRRAGPATEGLDVVRRLQPGRPTDALLREAVTGDLLVVGRRGAGGFEGLRLGSTAGHCARHARCPVVVVPAGPSTGHGRVVVGVDGSVGCRRALAWAVDHAGRRRAEVEVVGVYEPYDAPGPFGGEFMKLASPFSEQRFRERVEHATADAVASVTVPPDVELRVRVLAGHPTGVLLERAAQADLVVVGGRGLGGFEGLLLGSVGRQLLHHATCPVAIVRR